MTYACKDHIFHVKWERGGWFFLKGAGRGWWSSLGGGGDGGRLLRQGSGRRYFRILQLGSFLALEDGAADRERGGFVGVFCGRNESESEFRRVRETRSCLPSSSLHLGLARGSGPQSSTSSSSLGGLSSLRTQVERPQKGLRSQVLPGSTVAQRVDAKHIPGKSENEPNIIISGLVDRESGKPFPGSDRSGRAGTPGPTVRNHTHVPLSTSAGMSLLYVFGPSTLGFSSAARATATKRHRAKTNFMARRSQTIARAKGDSNKTTTSTPRPLRLEKLG